jgi:hypothetical protein
MSMEGRKSGAIIGSRPVKAPIELLTCEAAPLQAACPHLSPFTFHFSLLTSIRTGALLLDLMTPPCGLGISQK